MSTLLVTGGAGFLGSHLVNLLSVQGHNVVVMDNFSTSTGENIELFDRDKVKVIEHDVRESYNLEVDGIYNLACPASPIHYQKDPIATSETNFLGALNALKLAKKQGIPIFQASTSEVYGDPESSPQAEEYWGNVNPIGIRSCYDEGKRIAESLFFDFQRSYAVEIRMARIFNTYGPNMMVNDGRVVSNFILQALQNKPITIYGDGSQTRSFCFVSDTILGINKIMESNCSFPINLGNPIEQNMRSLAEEIIELTKSDSKISYEDLPKDDPKIRKPDITKAQTYLSWEPSVDLKTGLQETIKYFKNKL